MECKNYLIFSEEGHGIEKFTSNKLHERANEIRAWCSTIQSRVNDITTELDHLNKMKKLCHEDVIQMNKKLKIVCDSTCTRNVIKELNTCTDIVKEKLQNEYDVIIGIKLKLMVKCEEIFAYSLRLTELVHSLTYDMKLKTEAIKIEEQTELLVNTPLRYTFKNHYNYASYDSWLENCTNLMQKTETLLFESKAVRQKIRQFQIQSECDYLSCKESSDYALRKRISELEKLCDELNWQKEKLNIREQNLIVEMEKLQQSLSNEKRSYKLLSTQQTHRDYRVEKELCEEKCNTSMKENLIYLEKKVQIIQNELSVNKSSYNSIESQKKLVEYEFRRTNFSLNIEKNCLSQRNCC